MPEKNKKELSEHNVFHRGPHHRKAVIRTVMLWLMITITISSITLLSACNFRIPSRPKRTGVVNTADPNGPTPPPTPAATDATPGGSEQTPEYFAKVTPLPQTPEDPLSPENYPMPETFKTQLKDLLNHAGGANIYEKVYNIFNTASFQRPFFYYEYDDALTTLPGYLELAEYMMKNKHGVCYHYASLTCYLLRAAGMNACVIHGYRGVDEALHYWTMVETDQGWYHFDPLHHQMLLTDAEKSSDEATRGNGIIWQPGVWPATPETGYRY